MIDIVGGAALPSFFGRLNPNGRMVAVGVVAGYPPADFGMEMFAAFQRSLSFATFSTDTVPAPERRAATAALFSAASRGELDAVVHEELPLEQAALAHRKMDTGEVFGRIVLTPSVSQRLGEGPCPELPAGSSPGTSDGPGCFR
jgi:NADPH:quinone reductase-like Zn-dependent oxidoreductase